MKILSDLLGSGVLLISLSCLVSCNGQDKNGGNEQSAIPVNVRYVENRVINSGESYVGQVEEYKYSSLAFQVPGKLMDIRVSEGNLVRSGDILAVLDTASMRDAYRMAAATLSQAEDGYRRMKMLYDAGTLPEVKWVDINTQLEKARSAEQIAAKNLRDAVLRAPYDGVISSSTCGVGEVVTPGLAVMKIVSLEKLYVKISVPEKEIAQVDGRNIDISIPAAGKETILGNVEMKGVVANPLTHTYEVKALIENRDGKILPGMLAKVFVIKNTDEGTTVPVGALGLSNDGRRYLWTVNSEGKAERRFVTTGNLLDNELVITSGLYDGDCVIIEGGHKISEGMSVAVNNQIRR